MKTLGTKYTGVRYCVHKTRKHGINYDRCFFIRYTVDGKRKEEKAGWASEGMTADKAFILRADLMQAKTLGNGAVTLEEKRNIAERERKLNHEKPTLRSLWNLYIDDRGKIDKNDVSRMKHFEHLLDVKIDDLQTIQIDKLRNSLTNSGKSPQTVRNTIELIRRLVNFGVKKAYCARPCTLYFEMPKVNNQITEFLTDEQLSKYIKVLDNDINQLLASMVKLAMFTGIRREALLSLKWQDVDFNNGFITLCGENAKSGRTEKIPINDLAKELLEILNKNRNMTTEIIFHNKQGKKYNDIKFFLKRLREKTKDFLPINFRLIHGLRHTFASKLASSGVDLFTLQKLLTHGSTQMTQRYAHLADETVKKASNAFKIY